jgi:feruloyl esterase
VTAELARRQKERNTAQAWSERTASSEPRLVEGHGFHNPGGLRMLSYVPPQAPPSAALVVVLHGCTQTAAGYAQGAGWLSLAERYGFALLCPEQTQANNPNRCFNWFQVEDTTRGGGEVASIRAMIQTMLDTRGLDHNRVFVTGLSAGGAMAAALLATYPEVFAAGAIVAGLPYGGADSMPEAFAAMGGGRRRSSEQWAGAVRAASPHQGSWPRLSVWHGEADATVASSNGQALVDQWTALHGLSGAPPRLTDAAGRRRREWLSPDGRVAVEHHALAGLGHGTPLATTGEEPHGAAGPYLLETGVGSSLEIAGFWGLAPATFAAASPSASSARPSPPLLSPGDTVMRSLDAAGLGGNARVGGVNVREVIAKALTDAGLLR